MEGCNMIANPTDHRGQHGGEALSAAEQEKGDPRNQGSEVRNRSSGSAQIASVVIPLLEESKKRFHGTKLRLDYGVRKFDVSTGENWSVYFRVLNSDGQKASHYYIIDLSSRSPLIIMVDSLDIGSTVRRREVLDLAVQSHGDVTEQVVAKLLDRAAEEAGQQ
jgi:hypothetical protein